MPLFRFFGDNGAAQNVADLGVGLLGTGLGSLRAPLPRTALIFGPSGFFGFFFRSEPESTIQSQSFAFDTMSALSRACKMTENGTTMKPRGRETDVKWRDVILPFHLDPLHCSWSFLWVDQQVFGGSGRRPVTAQQAKIST